MKQKIIAFIDGLILYDYILFGAVGALFILFLILSILVRHKVLLSVFMILFSFALLLLGPTLGYQQMHKFLFKNTITITETKELEFTNALLIKGELTNSSKMPFSTCKITAGAYKVSGNAVMDMIFPFNPFKKGYVRLDTIIEPKQSEKFKLFIEPFNYSKEYNITIGASCQ
jgi:hypothetical protein